MGSDGTHPVAVVVTADDAAVRSELRPLLEGAPGVEVVAVGPDAEAGPQAAVLHAPAVLVLAIDRPGDISSLDTIGAVGKASPGMRVVVVVTSDDARFVRHALQAGAVACVRRHAAAEDLAEAVRRAGTEVGAAERLARAPARRPHRARVRRAGLLALGHTNTEIAARRVARSPQR